MILPVLPVDFNNADEDGAIRLNTRGLGAFLQHEGLVLHEGMRIRITDDELIADANVTMRDGIWVAVIQGGVTDVVLPRAAATTTTLG